MASPLLSILYQVHRAQPITRRQLTEQMGLSATHVSTLVSKLIARQLVYDQVPQDGTPGRPAALLYIHPDIGRAIGLDIGGGHSRAVMADFQGHVLASAIHRTQAVPDREVILENMVRLVEDVCQKGATQPERLTLLSVGVEGIVDTRSGVVLGWPSVPAWAEGWIGLNVPEELGNRLGIDTVLVDDSVRARGVAAHRLGPARGCENFVYVFLGNGIGSGVFVGGCSYEGSRGIAGELGHITVDEEGPWCSCGNRGCLEVMASTSAVLRRTQVRLSEPRLISTLRGPYERDELTLREVIEAARQGDKLAFQILDETGTYIGKVLAIVINLLGPELVVLGGPLAQADGIILHAAQRQVRLHALQHISKETLIVCDDQGELAGAHGAALLALDKFFASEGQLTRLLEKSKGPG